ncbi:MAG: hypothetical protein QM655_05410 [Nocardioidaceae bacterium]
MDLLAADLRGTGELRDDLDDGQVAQLIWLLNSPEWFSLITERSSSEEYAQLLADVLLRTLLTR